VNLAYDASIAYLDHHLGLLLSELRQRGVLEHTLVIITSYHGEHFGEHGLMHHSSSLYLPLLHVPLVISFPAGVPAGLTVRQPVSLRDLRATVFDLLALDTGTMNFTGQTLARYWSGARHAGWAGGRALGGRAQLCLPLAVSRDERHMRSLVMNGVHYVKNYGDRRERFGRVQELYNLAPDPLEKDNLVASPAHQPTLEQFRTSERMILAPEASAADSRSGRES
jgi:arylsulfatase A-like enzyme